VNLVWDPLDNAPSAPSEDLLSQYYAHLKEREWILWEKRGMLRLLLTKGCKCLGKEGKGIWEQFHCSND